MAHSIQQIGKEVAIINDLDLIVLVCLLSERLESTQGDYQAVSPLIAGWQADLSAYGPGTIDLGLEEIQRPSDQHSQFVALLNRVEADLERWGDTIKADHLDSLCRVPGVRFNDYPTELVRKAAAQLRLLMT